MINFNATPNESKTIIAIAKRAAQMAKELNVKYDLLTAQMDILACHLNGNPLNLDKLLIADDENFAHDIFGIRQHINRKTGKLTDCFLPRYSE